MQNGREVIKSHDDIPAIVADQVSEALSQQAYFIHTVLNTLDTLVLVADNKFRIILFNTACERLTGYELNEVKGKAFTDIFLLPEERPQVFDFGTQVVSGLKAGDTARYTNHWVAKNGEVFLIEWSNSVLSDCEGKIQFVVSTGTNITEYEKAKQALEYREKLFHGLFDNANDAIFVAPINKGVFGNYIEVNEVACKTLGFSRDEILQMSPRNIPVPDERDRRKYKENRSVTFEMDLLTKDGATIPFEHNAHLFELGGQTFSIAIARDIRERKQKEHELQENEKRYRQLVELSPDSIFVHANDRFLYANKACVKLLRAKSLRWLLRRKVSDIIHPDFREIIEQRMKKHKNGGSPALPMLEHLTLRFDGTAIEIESQGSLLYYNGQPAIQVIFRDITKKKKMEQEILRVNKLKSIGSLAGNIAHEYNNILTVIIGNLSLAQQYAADYPKMQDILLEVVEASHQAQEMTQRLLTFARGGQPVKRVINIRKLLFRCANMVLRQENANCNLAVPDDLLPVDADESQIYHAITNIIANALQAMPVGGTVRISAENIIEDDYLLLPDMAGPFIKITIYDEGTGIAAEHIGNIFDPFFTTKPGGKGLGLSTAYSIVKKHGGHISVESYEGKGTSFIIYLPAAPANFVFEDYNAADINGIGRILFMDDEALVRRTTQELLVYLGYEVVTATKGEEALQLYREATNLGQPFKYVILDLRIMGGMGGKETLKQLLEYDPNVKAVVSSGYSHDPVMANFKKHGFYGVVQKPFTIEQLGRALKALE